MPNWLLEHPLVYHFIRGYFDGDGCVTYCGLGPGRTIKQLSFSILGTKKFLEDCRFILEQNCQLKRNKINTKGNIFSLSYSGNKIMKKIYNFLYKDATIYLDRKKEKFQTVVIP